MKTDVCCFVRYENPAGAGGFFHYLIFSNGFSHVSYIKVNSNFIF